MLRLAPWMVAVTVAAAAATACSNSDNPSSPSGSSGTASVTSPIPSLPAANASLRYVDQPVTLTITNATATSAGTVYSFEVATDSTFGTKVQTKDSVAEGTTGQTSVKLDTLAGNKDYYWRVHAVSGGTSGPYSTVFKFTMGPQTTLNPPTPVTPINGSTVSPRPTLTILNSTRITTAGSVQYRFEISTSSTFSTTVATGMVAEGSNQTTWSLPSNLPANTTLYWRATGVDTTYGVNSNPSTVQTFVTRAFSQAENVALALGQTLWPGTQPPGTTGHATMGENWGIQEQWYQPTNHYFMCPDIEMLRIFDLLDHGIAPEDVAAWMNNNGYPTQALWYPGPEKAVIGLQYVYIAAYKKITVNGTWNIVIRVE